MSIRRGGFQIRVVLFKMRIADHTWVCFMPSVLNYPLTRLAQSRYAYALYVHGIVPFLITRQMTLDPV